MFKRRTVEVHTGDSTITVPVPDEALYCDRCGVLLDGDSIWIIDHDAYCDKCKAAWDLRVGATKPDINMEWAGTRQIGMLFDRDILMLTGPAKPHYEKATDKFLKWAGPTLGGCFILVADWVGWGDFEDGAVVVCALFPSPEAVESVADALTAIYDNDRDTDIVCVLNTDELWRQTLKPYAWVRSDGWLFRLESEMDWTPEAKELWMLAMRGGTAAA